MSNNSEKYNSFAHITSDDNKPGVASISFDKIVDLDVFLDDIFEVEKDLSISIRDIVQDGKSLLDDLLIDGGFVADNKGRILNLVKDDLILNVILNYSHYSSGGTFKSKEDLFSIISNKDYDEEEQKIFIIDDFIIVNGDYSNDHSFSDSIRKTKKFIKALSLLAHYHDNKSYLKEKEKLIFVSHNDKPIELIVKINDSILKGSSDNDYSLINSLVSLDADLKLKEKKSLFYSTLSEFYEVLGKPENFFESMISEWGKFEELFNYNFISYLNDFKLDKLKKELVESELKLTSNISDLITESVTKLLAVSASIAIIALLRRFSFPDFSENPNIAFSSVFIFMVGLLISSYFIFIIIKAQGEKLDSIKVSMEMLFSVLKNKETAITKLAGDDLNEIKDGLDGRYKNAKRILSKLIWFSYAPVVIYAISLAVVYGGGDDSSVENNNDAEFFISAPTKGIYEWGAFDYCE